MADVYEPEARDAAETLDRITRCSHDGDRDVVGDLVFCPECRGYLGTVDEAG